MNSEMIRALAQSMLGSTPAPPAPPASIAMDASPMANAPPAPEPDVKAMAQAHLASINAERANRGERPLVVPADRAASLGLAPTAPTGAAMPAMAPEREVPQTGLPGAEQVDPTVPAAEAPEGTVYGDDGAPLTPQALLAQIQKKRDADLQANHHVAGMQRAAAADTIKAGLDAQKATQPAEDALHQRIEQNMSELHDVSQEVDEQAKAANADYLQVNQEMKKVALAAPQDVWGQSGVNQMMGTAAMFFGGWGYNGNGPNRNLEMINSMADRAVAAQKAKFESLQAVGQGDKTLYGMLQQRLQNKQAVSGTLKNMALESYNGQIRSIANQYADPKYKAMAEQQAAEIAKQTMTTDQAIGQTYTANSQAALKLIAMEKARNTAVQAQALKRAQMEQDHGLGGYIGFMPISAEHTKAAGEVSGARRMVLSLNHVANALTGPVTIKEIRQLMVNYAGQFAAARKYLDTGTRIEEGEKIMLNKLNALPEETLVTSLLPEDWQLLKDKIDAIRYLVTEGSDTIVDTYAHGSISPDPNDPVFGPWRKPENALISDKKAAEKAARGEATNGAGQADIDALPNADGSSTAKAAPAQIVPGGY